jgi:hypothetical protein
MLVYSTRSEQVDTVLVDGKVLLRKGKLTGWDEAKVRADAQGEIERILPRIL